VAGASAPSPLVATPRWWVRGDLDGFLGLGLDNLIQILLIVSLCRGVLGYPDALIFGAILPATGINTVSLFAYVFLVMLPVKLGGPT